MRRFLASVVLAAVPVSSLAMMLASCGGGDASSTVEPPPDAAIHREGGLVDPPGTADGAADSAALPPAATCEGYCATVMANCKGAEQQYATTEECTAFCAALPPGMGADTTTPTVSCRNYFAGSPAKTDPSKYCPNAGPFGGGSCGDRCTAFCTVALAYCAVDAGGSTLYATNPECQSACVGWTYKDAGPDAYWNEALTGPTQGDSLNCRLYHLRSVVRGNPDCNDLGPTGGACK